MREYLIIGAVVAAVMTAFVGVVILCFENPSAVDMIIFVLAMIACLIGSVIKTMLREPNVKVAY